MFEFAAGEPGIVAAGLLPVALLGQVERALVLRHDGDAVAGRGQPLGKIGAMIEHALDDLPRHQQGAIGHLGRGQDGNTVRVDIFGVEGIER